MDGTIPGKYTKHPFVDMIAVFIFVMVLFVAIAANLHRGAGTDVAGAATGPLQQGAQAGIIYCDSCESCNQALMVKGVQKVLLSKDISSNSDKCLEIANLEGKVFDCELHSIDSSASRGDIITITRSNRITITNCVLDRSDTAIKLSDSYDSLIMANTISFSSIGILVASGSSNRIIGNRLIKPYEAGIMVSGLSGNNYIEGNAISESGINGIKLSDSRTVLLNNKACSSIENDILSDGSSNFGDGNTCSKAVNWADKSASEGESCMHACAGIV